MVFLRAAAGWLGSRPQLGIDTFAPPYAEVPREGGYVALMAACLTVLRQSPHAAVEGPGPRPVIPNLQRVTDVLTRITALLAARPEGGELAGFLPPIARDDPNRAIRARTAVASTLLAGPELAREGVVTIEQDAPMSECWRRPAY